jgi:hypothetical protein
MNKWSAERVPWQIWVAVALLGVEGISNASVALEAPVAFGWLAAKGVFIIGLLRAWRPVFILFMLVAAYHALYFSAMAPVVAVLNLALLLLVGSALRFFFPRTSHPPSHGRRLTSGPTR